MQLDPRFRAALYAVTVLLFLTGGPWLAIDWRQGGMPSEAAQSVETYLLMLHGAGAMLILLLLGALVALHLKAAWRSGLNRPAGIAMLASLSILIVTAYGLYYVGSESIRAWTSDLHIAIGLAFPFVLALHIYLGRRSVRLASGRASADAHMASATRRRHRVRQTRVTDEV